MHTARDPEENVSSRIDRDSSSIIADYLVDNKIISYTYQKNVSFFNNMDALYAQSTIQATYNLIRHIDINHSLQFFKENPSCLNRVVTVTDIHGQPFENTPLRILAAAGEFDPLETKEGNHLGLVHLMRPCFENPNDFEKQLQEQFKPGHEKVTKKRMARYVTAIETLIKDSKRSTDTSIAKKFKEALKPDLNDKVTVGLAWNMQIFLELKERLEANFLRTQRWYSDEAFFVDDATWPTLQARCSLPDLEIFASGISNVVNHQILPTRLDFSNGIPEILVGAGETHFFGLNQKWGMPYSRRCSGEFWDERTFLNLLSNQKDSIDSLIGQQCSETPRCLVM